MSVNEPLPPKGPLRTKVVQAKAEAQAKAALTKAEELEKEAQNRLLKNEVIARISVFENRIILRTKQWEALGKEIEHQKARLAAEQAKLKLMP
jgi:hypothetical protein